MLLKGPSTEEQKQLAFIENFKKSKYLYNTFLPNMSVVQVGPLSTASPSYMQHGVIHDDAPIAMLSETTLLDTIEFAHEPSLLDGLTAQNRLERLRLYLKLHGTGDPEDPHHVRFGLLGMNGGDQHITFRQLTRPPYTPAQLENMRVLSRYTRITTLSLTHNQVGDVGAQALARNRTITTLNLRGNRIGAAGARALAGNKTITLLNLRHNDVRDAGARALAGNKTITTLDLERNDVGDAGARALAGNLTITTLYLGRNDVGDAGARALAGNQTITTLDLWLNDVGVAGAQALAGNQTITSLDLADNHIGDAGLQALMANTTITALQV
jgi:hypothetical protein